MSRSLFLVKLNWAKTLLALLLIALTPALYFYNEHNKTVNQVAQRQAALDALTQELATAIEADLNGKIDEQIAMVNSELFKTAPIGSPAFNPVLEKYKAEYPDFIWVGIADKKGTIKNDAPKLLVGVDASKRPWFVNGTNQSFFGDLHEAVLLQSLLSKDGKDPLRMVDIANPIYDNNKELKGVLSAHLNWEWASKLIKAVAEKNTLAGQTEIVLLNSDDAVIYVNNPNGAKEDGSMSKRVDYLTSKQKLNVKTVTPDHQWQVLTRQPAKSEQSPAPTSPLWFIGGLLSLLSLLYLIIGLMSIKSQSN